MTDPETAGEWKNRLKAVLINDDAECWASVISVVEQIQSQEYERGVRDAARIVNHILKEGGGTYGDLVLSLIKKP